ncbi:MAG: hypothetical protein LAO51_07670 [Acidobacteriia bacterium]|nr:hypothetical protein [Terriglobia bacterium]
MRTSLLSLSLLAVALSPAAVSEETPPAPARLDWTASQRWIHVDTVPSEKVSVFESARVEWLRELNAHAPPLADGRALFWSADRGAVTTYFTFYPFAKWSDLTARGAMIEATNAAVGKDALSRYDDRSDAALVPPHRSEIWVVRPDFAFEADPSRPLDETTAAAAWVEFQHDRFDEYDRMTATWKTVTDALRQQHFPLTCRTFRSSYGSGDLVRLWLASDEVALRSAPTLERAVRRALGRGAGKTLAEYRRLFPTSERFVIRRRAEMSQMAP